MISFGRGTWLTMQLPLIFQLVLVFICYITLSKSILLTNLSIKLCCRYLLSRNIFYSRVLSNLDINLPCLYTNFFTLESVTYGYFQLYSVSYDFLVNMLLVFSSVLSSSG